MVSEAVPTVAGERMLRPASPPAQHRVLLHAQTQRQPEEDPICDLLRSPMRAIPAPPELGDEHCNESGERDDDAASISTLGVSHASSAIQAVAVQEAVLAWRATVADHRTGGPWVGEDSLVGESVSQRRVARAPPGSDAAAKRSAASANLDEGILSTITLAMRPHANTTKKQRSKASASARVATVEQRSKCPVLLDDFVAAGRRIEGVSYAEETLRKYPLLFDEDWLLKRDISTAHQEVTFAHFNVNFTIPKALLSKLQSSDDKARAAFWSSGSRARPVVLTGASTGGEYVSRIDGAYSVRGFTGRNLAAFSEYCDAVRQCAAYELDMAWLLRMPTDSDDNSYPYPAFSDMGSPLSTADVASRVVNALESCSLDSAFEIDIDGETTETIQLAEVLGYAAGESRLNDSVFVFAMKQIASVRSDVIVFNSLRPLLCGGQLPFSIPAKPLSNCLAAIFPVSLTQAHWGLIIASFNADNAIVMLYDPLVDEDNHAQLRSHWEQYCRPFVSTWMARDQVADSTTTAQELILERPKQAASDGRNCGIYCISVCTDLVASTSGFEALDTLSPATVCELRLRALWGITCKTTKVDSAPRKEKTRALHDFSAFSREMEKREVSSGRAKVKAARRLGK